MKLSKKSLNSNISTLNLVLFIIGYQLTTSLFLPVSSSGVEGLSQSVTIPYRAFALLISLIVLLINFKQKSRKVPFTLILFWLYWLALIIRIFYDTFIRQDVHILNTSQLWMYILGIILPTMYSIMKSYKIIDYEKALRLVFIGTVLTMILTLFNNSALLIDTSEINDRAEGNIALDTISLGHLGTMGVLLSLYILFKRQTNLLKKIILIITILFSFFIMVRAGSRSPVLALVVVLIFWISAKGENLVLGSIITIVLFVLLFMFIDPILDFVGNISPLMELRLRMSIFEGDTSGRDPLYTDAFKAFIDNPIFGSQFALLNISGEFNYSHNIILDSLMGLGLLGGITIIYIYWESIKYSYYLIKNNDQNFWFALILIQQIVLSMVSSAIYYNPILNVLLVLVIIYSHFKINTNNT